MVSESSRRREEDEMLKYAHVERTVKKHYAIRYNGYIDDLPHFFLKDVVKRHLRGYQSDLEFRPVSIDDTDVFAMIASVADDRNNQICREGDWVVVFENRQSGHLETRIYADNHFRSLFMPMRDLDY